MQEIRQKKRRSFYITAIEIVIIGAVFLLFFLCGSTASPLSHEQSHGQDTSPTTTPVYINEIGVAATETPLPVQVVLQENHISATPVKRIDVDELQFEPAGCRKPGDDYSRIWMRGYVMNKRTYEMLEYAYSLYGGEIDITNLAITQGSFSDNGSASFGTHLGGGAVDISVRSIEDYSVLYHEIEPLVRALRTAGFAAWLRDNDEVYPGTGIHIHAIAIGDEQLSYPAQQQLTGKFGYFRGYNGIPNDDGRLIADRHGGALLCNWMRDLGYDDLRSTGTDDILSPGILSENWQEDVRLIAMSYVTSSVEETASLAVEIDFLPWNKEMPKEMRAPLAAQILIETGFIPGELSPAGNVMNFHLAQLAGENMPWQIFSPYDFSIEHFDEPVTQFEFSFLPLLAGDLIVAYGESGIVPELFTVTEVDDEGRVYTVTPVQVNREEYIVRREVIYDEQDTAASAFINGIILDHQGRPVGSRGFDIIRRKGVTLPPGSVYTYTVQAGDTIRSISHLFHSTIERISEENDDVDIEHLVVGQELAVIVGPL